MGFFTQKVSDSAKILSKNTKNGLKKERDAWLTSIETVGGISLTLPKSPDKKSTLLAQSKPEKDPLVGDLHNGMFAKTLEANVTRTALEQQLPDDATRLARAREELLSRSGQKTGEAKPKNPPQQAALRFHTNEYFEPTFVIKPKLHVRQEEQKKQQQEADETWQKKAFEQRQKNDPIDLGRAMTAMENKAGYSG